jgi:hypothetical protein
MSSGNSDTIANNRDATEITCGGAASGIPGNPRLSEGRLGACTTQ